MQVKAPPPGSVGLILYGFIPDEFRQWSAIVEGVSSRSYRYILCGLVLMLNALGVFKD